jgi:hypothetical protein
MKGDFSRVTWMPEKHYRGVRMQQGRVQLDADWNEQLDISAYLAETEALDVIGQHGGPMTTTGFALVTRKEDLPPAQQAPAARLFPLAPGDFVISAGHYYVDGILCENDSPCAYTGQPDLRGVTAIADKGVHLAYLDVWEQHVTALEDPDIREVALGGPDTATRTRLVCQVKLMAIKDQTATCGSPVPELTAATSAPSGRLRARAQPSAVSKDPCLIEPDAGYRRLENQLYRVEIHQGGNRGQATFKWSRDNGSIVAAWLAQDGNELTVSSAGKDRILGFAEGDWVELTDDSRELRGLPGTLVQLTAVDGQAVTFAPPSDSTVNLADFPLNPKIRRWNTLSESGTVVVGTPAANDGFLELEGGVEVKFEAGTYATGDYWLVPARTAIGSVDWPFTEAQPPRGIRHHYCRLALLTFDGSGLTIRDCRRLFPAVTELTNLFAVGGNGQLGAPGEKLLQPLQVGVANGQWPVKGATVRFQVTAGGGKLQGTSSSSVDVVTGPDGIASCTWNVGTTTPSQQVTATLLDSTGTPMHLPVHFHAALSAAGVAPGVHVNSVIFGDKTVLENDGNVSNTQLITGIQVQCDADVAPESVNRQTCAVSVELPFPLSDADTKLWGTGVFGFQEVLLAGAASAATKSIAWTPTSETADWLVKDLFAPLRLRKLETRILAHLTLRGNFIWDAKNPELFLDGEVLGVRQLDKVVRTAVRLPSGDGRRGGTLEMWFWLVDEVGISLALSAPFVRIEGLAIVTVTVAGTDDKTAELSVEGVIGGNATVGTIARSTENTNEWIYTAPAKLPPTNPVDIVARSLADRTKAASVSLLIMGRIITDPGPVPFRSPGGSTEAPGAPKSGAKRARSGGRSGRRRTSPSKKSRGEESS